MKKTASLFSPLVLDVRLSSKRKCFKSFFLFFGAIYMNVPFLVAVILLPSWDDATRMASKPVENKLKVGCLTLRKHYFYKYVSHKKVLIGVFIT